jgi:hypothetical protein
MTTFSTRAKWRSLWRARSGVLKEALDRADTLIDDSLLKFHKADFPTHFQKAQFGAQLQSVFRVTAEGRCK